MKRVILPLLFLLVILVLVVMVPDRVAALTVQVCAGEPSSDGTSCGTQIASLTTFVADPENGSKRTIFLSIPPALNSTTSQCTLGTAKDYTVSSMTFRFSDLTTPVSTTICSSGLKAVRARVYVDNSNASAPKMVFLGKITMVSGNAAKVTVRAISSSGTGDYLSNTAALTFGVASKGVFKRSGLSTDTTVTIPTNNTVKITTRANPSNVVNTSGSSAPANSLSTADPPSASIPPSTFQSGASCTTVGSTKSCSANFDIADTESNISCSSTPCPFVKTDWTYGFNRNGDSMEKTGSGVTAFSASLGAVLDALEQCNVWASNPPALGTRIVWNQPAEGGDNSFSNGQASISAKAFAVVSGGPFFLASPLSAFYVTVPGSLVNDNESVVAVVPGLLSLDTNGNGVCNRVGLANVESLTATYAFQNNTDCQFSSYRFQIAFDNGQTAVGMFGQKQGQFFGKCASTNQSGLNFVTNPDKNWQLEDVDGTLSNFISFGDLRDALNTMVPIPRITSLELVLDQGLSTKDQAGFQLVTLSNVSFKLNGQEPVVFAPPPAGQETPILDLPQAAAVVTKLATGQTAVIPEDQININNSQWVFHVPMSILFGAGNYEMRMCLSQLCPGDPVDFCIFASGNKCK